MPVPLIPVLSIPDPSFLWLVSKMKRVFLALLAVSLSIVAAFVFAAQSGSQYDVSINPGLIVGFGLAFVILLLNFVVDGYENDKKEERYKQIEEENWMLRSQVEAFMRVKKRGGSCE